MQHRGTIRKIFLTFATLLAMGVAVVGTTTTANAAPVASSLSGTAAPGLAAASRGYVTEGNLRRDPNLGAAKIVTIYNQWVDILCWLDGGDNGFGSNRWFKAQYYSNVGYLSSGVVSHQPSVGHC